MLRLFATLLFIGSLAFGQIGPIFPGPGTAHSAGSTTITQVGGGACNFTGASPIATGVLNTSTATLLVVVSSNFTGSATITDSKSNTWTDLSEYTAANGNKVKISYVVNPTVGSGHTFTATGNLPGLCAMAFSGVKTSSPFDQANGAVTVGGTLQPGSVTPSENGELLITGVSNDTSATAAINSSFTGLVQVDTIAMAYKVQTTAGAENPTWSNLGGGSSVAAAIATFKVAP